VSDPRDMLDLDNIITQKGNKDGILKQNLNLVPSRYWQEIRFVLFSLHTSGPRDVPRWGALSLLQKTPLMVVSVLLVNDSEYSQSARQ